MPYPQDKQLYRKMVEESGVISAAINSLAVQVDWTGAHIVGADDSGFGPLIEAFSEYGGLEEALQRFTGELFCFGNVAVFVRAAKAICWEPAWRTDPEHQQAASQGVVLEAKMKPISNGYGQPVVEPALAAFQQYAAHWIQELGSNSKPTPGFAQQNLIAVNQVLAAMGFEAWIPGGDTPRFQYGNRIRSEVKRLFETQLLQPFGKIIGAAGTPSIAP